MNATFGLVGSAKMRVTNRFGIDGVSMRLNVTSAAGPSAFFETKSRPKFVPAHSVPPSNTARSAATMSPPTRSLPYNDEVRSPGWREADAGVLPVGNGYTTPSGRQSPQTAPATPPEVRQFASRYV